MVAAPDTALLLVGLPNQGDGLFGEASRLVPVRTVERMALGDLNGDGRMDLVLASPETRQVGIALAGTRER